VNVAAGDMERPKAHDEAVDIAIPNKEVFGDAGYRG
jgi:CRISP-associated protein Cas1